MVNTSDSGFRGRGFEPHSGRRVVSLSKTYLPPKVLVIPRKRWLHPNMTEKLFTGTLSIKPNQTKTFSYAHSLPNGPLKQHIYHKYKYLQTCTYKKRCIVQDAIAHAKVKKTELKINNKKF